MDNDTPIHPPIGDVAAALAKAAADIGTVAETGKNDHHRYRYASVADLARAVQPALSKHGLAIVPLRYDTEWSGNGCRVTAHYRIVHSSGQHLDAVAIGEGIDKGDKAAYKAQTGAWKYLVRTLFAIPTGDDAEQDSPQRSGSRAQSNRRPGGSEPRAGWDRRKAIAKAVQGQCSVEDVERWLSAVHGADLDGMDIATAHRLAGDLRAGTVDDVVDWLNTNAGAKGGAA